MAEILKPDLCIIGASAAGIRLATRARQYGASVILIDRGEAGAESQWNGAIPADALAASAARAHALRTASALGMANDEPKPNFRAVHDHVRAVIDAMAPAVSAERLAALGIEMILGTAAFTDRRTLKAGEALIRARRFVIATGSRPAVPAIRGLDQVPFFTTQSIFTNAKKLTHLVVLGGRTEAIELAQAYRRLGSLVTLIEAGKALPDHDPELAEIALRSLREEGLVIHEQTELVEIVARNQGIGVNIRHGDGREAALDASHILAAAGRVPDLDGLGLDKARIRRDKDRPDRLALGKSLKTSNGKVFAIGEAAGIDQPHAALEQADLVLENALFGIAGHYDPALVPLVVSTDPGLAHIGLTEPEVRARYKGAYSVLRASFAENDHARATRRTDGVAKLIVSPRGAILGAAVAGAGASELIALFALVMAKGLSAADLAGFIAPHPAFATLARQLGETYDAEQGPDKWRQRRMALARLLP
jgi:pyruvate/2-oxoglutarate dehydrogenase complex dihydrolipoamide dehydrogenase (E3) component